MSSTRRRNKLWIFYAIECDSIMKGLNTSAQNTGGFLNNHAEQRSQTEKEYMLFIIMQF